MATFILYNVSFSFLILIHKNLYYRNNFRKPWCQEWCAQSEFGFRKWEHGTRRVTVVNIHDSHNLGFVSANGSSVVLIEMEWYGTKCNKQTKTVLQNSNNANLDQTSPNRRFTSLFSLQGGYMGRKRSDRCYQRMQLIMLSIKKKTRLYQADLRGRCWCSGYFNLYKLLAKVCPSLPPYTYVYVSYSLCRAVNMNVSTKRRPTFYVSLLRVKRLVKILLPETPKSSVPHTKAQVYSHRSTPTCSH